MNTQLINRVLDQIQDDIVLNKDLTALEELLQFCPEDKLQAFLPK